VLAQPAQQRPRPGERAYLVTGVFPERPERLAVRATQHDPAQPTEPVLI